MNDLLHKAVEAFKALSPEQQRQMLEAQRQSWVQAETAMAREDRAQTSVVMPIAKPPSEIEVFNAIEYALRREGVTEIAWAEDGEYEVEIYDANNLKPFVLCLLRELKVIP